MLMWVLLILWIIASIGVGFALGRFLHKCEVNSWDAPTNSQAKNQPAPGADWGTWSHTTPSTHGTATWIGVGHDPSGNQY